MGMFGYWTKCARCWESEEYCKCTAEQMAEYNRQSALKVYKQENPSATTEPVFRGDVIGNYNKETQQVDNQFYITRIGEQGQVIGVYLDNRNYGKEQEWKGEFVKTYSVVQLEIQQSPPINK